MPSWINSRVRFFCFAGRRPAAAVSSSPFSNRLASSPSSARSNASDQRSCASSLITGPTSVEYRPERPSERFPLDVVDSHTLVLRGSAANLPAHGEVVRLLTADGWVYPYHVEEAAQSAGRIRIRVAEGPGLTFDGTLRLTAYPQREHAGPAEVDWIKQ